MSVCVLWLFNGVVILTCLHRFVVGMRIAMGEDMLGFLLFYIVCSEI